jgi:Delta3-Delta2-enoyl-CoA isomerase
MSAALVAHADFVYCVPSTYLLTPFASLGLVSEGVSSEAFVRRMGTARANEALLMGRRIGSGELREAGFVNRVVEVEGEGSFKEEVLKELSGRFCEAGLNQESVLITKRLIVERRRRDMDAQSVEEVFIALDRNVKGIPQKQFEKLRKGLKKHKL